MTPAPGIILLEPLEEKEGLVLGKNTTRLLQGRVLQMGTQLTTNFGAKLNPEEYAKEGDIITFLSYEGDYDWLKIDGKKYYFVKFEDCRGIIKENK